MPPSDPPFNSNPAHLDFQEAHRLESMYRDRWHKLDETDPESILDTLTAIIEANGVRRTLNQIASHVHLVLQMGEERNTDYERSDEQQFEVTPENDPGLPPRLCEYAAGLALTTDSDQTTPHSFEDLARSLLKLVAWHKMEHRQYRNRVTSARQDIALRGFSSLAFRELTTLRHADGLQMLEKAYRLYKPWEEEMEAILGFSIEDALYYHDRIFEARVDDVSEMTDEQVQYTDSLVALGEPVIERADETLWFERDELVDICDNSDRFHAFLERMSASPGKVPTYELPFDVNPLHVQPIPKVDGEYMLPLPRTMAFALANTFYYDLIDSDHGGEFGDGIGSALEDWAADSLRRVFPESDIYENVEYTAAGERAEADLVVEHDGVVLVIECKGKRLTAQTRIGEHGGDESAAAIQSDVNASIGAATRQAERLASRIESGEIETLQSSTGATLDLSASDIDVCYRVVVLGESYGAVATREFAGMLDLPTIPYVCDIYDLQVIGEVLDDPEDFLTYVKERIRMTEVQTSRIIRREPPVTGSFPNQHTFSSDEIDYLGVFHRNNNTFPIGARAIIGAGDDLRIDAVTDIEERNEMKHLY